MKRLLRIAIAFSAACLLAAYTKLLFAVTPVELAALPSDVATDRLLWIANLGWKIAVLFGLFALPFAIVGITIGELRAVRNWLYYLGLGLTIAIIGYIAQVNGETPRTPTVVTAYAMAAYAVSGILAGLGYWLLCGRSAAKRGSAASGGDQHNKPSEPTAKSAPPASPAKTTAPTAKTPPAAAPADSLVSRTERAAVPTPQITTSAAVAPASPALTLAPPPATATAKPATASVPLTKPAAAGAVTSVTSVPSVRSKV